MNSFRLHGTCVDINGKAVLITGDSGSGKSSLALQLIDRGATLISDDQTELSQHLGKILANAPDTIKGLLEVRGVGLVQFPIKENSPLLLVVDLCEPEALVRLPEPLFFEYDSIKIPMLRLKLWDPLGAIKIELKVNQRDEEESF